MGIKQNGQQYDVRVVVRQGSKFLTKRKKNVPTLREAKQLERQFYSELQTAKKESPGQLTWGELYEEWLRSSYARERLSAATIERYSYSLERGVNLEWATDIAADIDHEKVVKFLDDYTTRRNLTQSSKIYQHKIISIVFAYGVHKGLLSENPCSKIKLKQPKPLLKLWTKDQIREFLGKLKPIDPTWHAIFTIAVNTGMRAGELTALKWQHVDLANRRLNVCEAYDRIMNEEKSPKNGEARITPINGLVIEALEFLKREKVPGGYVFPRIYELLHSTQSAVFRRYAKVFGLPPLKFHALRAMFATFSLQAGIPLNVVMSMGGWKSLEVMRRYVQAAGIEVTGATDNIL